MRGKFDRTDSEGGEQIFAEHKRAKVVWFEKFPVVKAFKRYPYKDSFFTNKTIGSTRKEKRRERERERKSLK